MRVCCSLYLTEYKAPSGSNGKINKFTVPVLVDWLSKHEIPYDELIVGKPWPGPEGYMMIVQYVPPNSGPSLNKF